MSTLISIQDASEISNKSIQTIRRAIKSKKLKFKRKKTPQGFNYLIDKDSLFSLYNIKTEASVKEFQAELLGEVKEEPKKEVSKKRADEDFVTNDEFKNFTKLLEKMINQHSEERQNYMRLVGGLQEKVFVLENQLNLLKTPARRWYQVWK